MCVGNARETLHHHWNASNVNDGQWQCSVFISCAGAIVGGVLLVAVAVMVLFSALLCAMRRKRRHKFERGGEASLCHERIVRGIIFVGYLRELVSSRQCLAVSLCAESRENEFVLIATGTAISSDNMSSAHLSPAHTLQASTSSSPPRQGSTSSLHTAPTKK